MTRIKIFLQRQIVPVIIFLSVTLYFFPRGEDLSVTTAQLAEFKRHGMLGLLVLQALVFGALFLLTIKSMRIQKLFLWSYLIFSLVLGLLNIYGLVGGWSEGLVLAFGAVMCILSLRAGRRLKMPLV